MTRVPAIIFTVGLMACGGSTPKPTSPKAATEAVTTTATAGDTTPAGGAGDVATDEPAPAPADGGTTTPDKPARPPQDSGAFEIHKADRSSRPTKTKLVATDTEAAVRFFVIDKDNGPITGVVISLTAPDGTKYYTQETDAEGFAEVLVPIGTTYDLVYLSLGRRNVSAQVEVANEPRLNLKLTMRYKRDTPPPPVIVAEPTPSAPAPAEPPPPPPPRFVLQGVQFETGKATLTSGSYERLASVIEYMTHKPSAVIEISGHTDNVGNKKDNKKLSQQRADAVRAYLVSKGIDGGRIKTVGYGDERPIATNDTPEGRQQNRRIEAAEL